MRRRWDGTLPDDSEGRESSYDNAQVCPNGHVANHSMQHNPEANRDFCEECGEKTISNCPHCNAPLRGLHWTSICHDRYYSPPAHCRSCGKPFPWTERRIQAAIDLAAEEESLSAEEKRQFNQSVNDITRDTPQAQVGATRLKKLLAKFGKETAKVARDMVVNVASEAVKKTIWPGTPWANRSCYG